MALFVTSDTHFGHKNIIKYEAEKRPFASIEAHDEALIQNWNAVVGENDVVIHCGDFIMGSLDHIDKILSRLNGKIVLVRGNHDTEPRLKYMQEKWHDKVSIHDIYYHTYRGRFFIFCHFPIASEEFIDMVKGDHSEVILCYGHIHSKAPNGYADGTYHIGVDTNRLTPVSLEQIWNESWPEETMTPEVTSYKKQHVIAHNDCDKCLFYPMSCGEDPANCTKFERDPPDGGFYG